MIDYFYNCFAYVRSFIASARVLRSYCVCERVYSQIANDRSDLIFIENVKMTIFSFPYKSVISKTYLNHVYKCILFELI